jgi:GNAT superfamily N-acetyltransferase
MIKLREVRAGGDDAETIARLHAESWRRHYRGAFADSFLDGDVLADRLEVWTARLADPGHSATFVAEDEAQPLGFAHVILDHDQRWGSLLDNLHVVPGRQRQGIGKALIAQARRTVAERAAGPAMYLWVLEQNVSAQRFYRAQDGVEVQRAPAHQPGGVPGRLNGTPMSLRIWWPGS